MAETRCHYITAAQRGYIRLGLEFPGESVVLVVETVTFTEKHTLTDGSCVMCAVMKTVKRLLNTEYPPGKHTPTYIAEMKRARQEWVDDFVMMVVKPNFPCPCYTPRL